MFSSDEKVGRWITTWLHFQETTGKAVSSSHASPLVCNIILCNWIYITRSSKDTALNVTATRGFRGRLTLTEDIMVELSILGPIPGLHFLAKKVLMEGTSQGFILLAIVSTADPSIHGG